MDTSSLSIKVHLVYLGKSLQLTHRVCFCLAWNQLRCIRGGQAWLYLGHLTGTGWTTVSSGVRSCGADRVFQLVEDPWLSLLPWSLKGSCVPSLGICSTLYSLYISRAHKPKDTQLHWGQAGLLVHYGTWTPFCGQTSSPGFVLKSLYKTAKIRYIERRQFCDSRYAD